MVRSNPRLHARHEESLKPTVAETLDHLGTVTLHVTVVKQPNASVELRSGPGGWFALRVVPGFDADELHSLALESYRHHGSRRMLATLEVGASPGAATAKAVSARGRARAAPVVSGAGVGAAASTRRSPARGK